MQKQFVTYEIALKLKELGFDEECLGWFWGKTPVLEIGRTTLDALINPAILAPLWQQAIDWLREKHSIFVSYDFEQDCPDIPKYYAVVKSLSCKPAGETILDGFTLFPSPELALEQGILETLYLIIDK